MTYQCTIYRDTGQLIRYADMDSLSKLPAVPRDPFGYKYMIVTGPEGFWPRRYISSAISRQGRSIGIWKKHAYTVPCFQHSRTGEYHACVKGVMIMRWPKGTDIGLMVAQLVAMDVEQQLGLNS